MMNLEGPNVHQRRLLYLDWLKVLAVLGVFFAHSIDMLDLVDWHTRYQEHAVGIMIFTSFGSQWGMALMFLLAGATAQFALGSRNGAQFINERVKRLLIPSIFGILLLSPIEAYFDALRRLVYDNSFFQFVPHFFASIHIGGDFRWLASFGYHLWFLVFLFLISLLSLPLLILLRRKQGLRLIHWLAAISTPPGGLLLLAIPFILVQVFLKAPFPGYQNWADCFSWLLSFWYGYILLADARFEQAIRSQRRFTLLAASACLLLLVGLYMMGYIQSWEARPDFSIGYICYQLLRGLLNWSLLAFILYFAMRFLDAGNRLLSYMNEAALPFYILHYPVVVITAFYIESWSDNPLLRFLLISTMALILTLALYELLVRRIPLMRLLFGMKPPKYEDDIKPLVLRHAHRP
ncbi:MAG TPA: acyltransferase family protein [Ktedonosporobacter sp.]|jgi:hypothetical protein|nr:acyltransferase family protein [Ktedonosporobacter sp.]